MCRIVFGHIFCMCTATSCSIMKLSLSICSFVSTVSCRDQTLLNLQPWNRSTHQTSKTICQSSQRVCNLQEQIWASLQPHMIKCIVYAQCGILHDVDSLEIVHLHFPPNQICSTASARLADLLQFPLPLELQGLPLSYKSGHAWTQYNHWSLFLEPCRSNMLQSGRHAFVLIPYQRDQLRGGSYMDGSSLWLARAYTTHSCTVCEKWVFNSKTGENVCYESSPISQSRSIEWFLTLHCFSSPSMMPITTTRCTSFLLNILSFSGSIWYLLACETSDHAHACGQSCWGLECHQQSANDYTFEQCTRFLCTHMYGLQHSHASRSTENVFVSKYLRILIYQGILALLYGQHD